MQVGNTVLVIEHHLDVIKMADWVIDLGPEGGTHGGEVIGTGTPEEIARNPLSHTGRFLRRVLHAGAAKFPGSGRSGSKQRLRPPSPRDPADSPARYGIRSAALQALSRKRWFLERRAF